MTCNFELKWPVSRSAIGTFSRRWFLGLFVCAQLVACSSPIEAPAPRRPALYSGPNQFHDLTDLNYVTLWAVDFDANSDVERVCVLNDQPEPCTKYMRAKISDLQPYYGAEYFLPALPLGENRFEVRSASGAPLAVTEFVVCRRTIEVDFTIGLDNKVGTSDDQVERVRTFGWENGLASWEVISEGPNSATLETLIHSYEHRTTDTVEYFDQDRRLLKREIRHYSLQGPLIGSETYSPAGEFVEYLDPCYSFNELNGFVASDTYFDGSCHAFAPSVEDAYGHPGSDMSWRTHDDYLIRGGQNIIISWDLNGTAALNPQVPGCDLGI